MKYQTMLNRVLSVYTNLQYWKMKDYLGMTQGAHSRLTDKKGCAGPFEPIGHPANGYLRQKHTDMRLRKKFLSSEEQIFETLMMGLRLKKDLKADFKILSKKIEEIFTGRP